ncbi:transposase [Candidatus Uhrbacteria bacterium]|nr:transposase [Candidatus Uhrbacteria bacterium]
MPIRATPFVHGEYYHIFARGNNKQDIFSGSDDYARFLIALMLFQAPPSLQAPITNIRRLVRHLVQSQALNITDDGITTLLKRRYVHLVAFALMPNHFHCIVQERHTHGISMYMQRVLTSYAKYRNTKHERTGHLFEGPFKSVHIEDDAQLTYCSAYIHRNPRELPGWRGREHEYPWSSYRDYCGKNRWGELLTPTMVFDLVGRGDRYRAFVEASGAKKRATHPLLHID